jgi:hypothetical protein
MDPSEQVAEEVLRLAHQTAVGVVDPDVLLDAHTSSLRPLTNTRN